MARIRYSASDLRRQIRVEPNSLAEDAKRDPDLYAEVTPPSGKAAGVDAFTEINGFRQDAVHAIEEPMMAEFPDGATQQDIAAFLQDLPNRFQTRAESAGPFLVKATERLSKHLAPDVMANKEPPKQQMPADDFVKAMEGYRYEFGLYEPVYLQKALKAIDQPDMLTDRNIDQLIEKVGQHADMRNDSETMANFWPDVEDDMKAAFDKGAAAYAETLAADAGPAPSSPRPGMERKAG